MKSLHLLKSYGLNNILSWRHGAPVTCSSFLADVGTLAASLPETLHAINLCEDRYWFLVGFAASLSRGHTTLLPQSRAPLALEQMQQQFPSSYRLTDLLSPKGHGPTFSIPRITSQSSHHLENPLIPEEHIGLVAFTSGTTGSPRPCPKTWHSLVSVAQKTARHLHLEKTTRLSIVATVPPQHMYGLETSVMLPIRYGWALHPGRPLFPEDIRSALELVSAPRILVTTPFHLRSCVTDGTRFPDLDCIVSATAPLSVSLARQAEQIFKTQVWEIYGFAEAGTLATRRPSERESWKLLEELSLQEERDGYLLHGPHLLKPVYFPDKIIANGPRQFFLSGRSGEFINIAGHRISLGELNNHLISIEGVQDGVFYMQEDERVDQISRLAAFVVAPEKNSCEILDELRKRIDSVFLPRPIYFVRRLPRNATGKLPREELFKLLLDQENNQSNF